MSSAADEALITSLKRKLSSIYGRKRLLEYFKHKGFDDLDTYVYPPALNDLPALIPEMRNKVEIKPFSERIDPTTGMVQVGWNLFVLGINRQFLGFSFHTSAQDLQRAFGAKDTNQPQESKRKASEIIDFIVETLETNKDGLLDPSQVTQRPDMFKNVDGYGQAGMSPQPLPSGTGFGYERPRPVN